MLEINRYKLNLYELLFNNPLCDYRTKEELKSKINVLFIGKADYAIETYKTLFWASQYPDSKLNMTYVADKTSVDYVGSVMCDKSKFPALEEYIEKGYAEALKFVVEENINKREKIKDCIQRSGIGQNEYCYVIIASGDADLDWTYINSIEMVCEYNFQKVAHVNIGLYNNSMNDKLSKVKWDKVTKNLSLVQFENSEEDVDKSDLRRIASNINLSYSMMYDQRLNVADNIEDFNKLCKEEFDETDSDSYNADSSYASAVHISSKLSYCLQYSGLSKTDNWREDALKILSDSVKEENELYKKLYYWEHKRWNAYMVVRGYRHPRKGEWGFVYSEGNKNYDSKNKLHVCLCESGTELNPEMNKPSFWKKIKAELNQLDYASYYCNSIANNKVKELEKRIYKKYTFLNSIVFRELKDAIEDLFLEVGNSIDNYKEIMSNFLNRGDISKDDDIVKELNELNKEIGIVIKRNQHINFFEYDAQLVRMIPFVLWYGVKYQKVYVFSKGIASKDVVIPTLLYAKKAYIVSKNVCTDKYKDVIRRYFKERGNNTDVEFISFEEMVNATSDIGCEEFVITGEGEFKEDYLVSKKNVVNVRYDAANNVINNFNLFCGLNRQSFSVKEFIRLQGGDVKEEFRDNLSKKMYNDYERLFWEFSKKIKSGDYLYIPWNKVIKIFTKDSRTDTADRKKKVEFAINKLAVEERSNRKVAYICDAMISQDTYLENQVDVFLNDLYDYHLITKYTVDVEESNIRIKFITYHKEICKVIEDYAVDDIDYTVAKLVYGCNIEPSEVIDIVSKKLSIIMDHRDSLKCYANQFNSLLTELEKLGAIDGYDISNNKIETVTVKDMRVLKLFEKEGDVFEKITFHRFKNSNLFDDSKNGIIFYWNREAGETDILEKMLKMEVAKNAKKDLLNLVDFDRFTEINNEVFKIKESDYEKNQVCNEIDVIVIRGMQAYFVSCKATSEIKKEYLDEIANHSKNAGAIPILATGISQNCLTDAILSRAKELNNIWILGRDELNNQDKFNDAIKSYIF